MTTRDIIDAFKKATPKEQRDLLQILDIWRAMVGIGGTPREEEYVSDVRIS